MDKYDKPDDGLRRVWLYICKFFVFVSILAELLVFIAQIIVVSDLVSDLLNVYMHQERTET